MSCHRETRAKQGAWPTGPLPRSSQTEPYGRLRIFAGYSGWGPGQLEAEMAEDSWIVDSARREDVFTDEPDALWRTVLRRKGPEDQQMSRVPFDPSMN